MVIQHMRVLLILYIGATTKEKSIAHSLISCTYEETKTLKIG